ncbi:MAG: glycerate kinase [Verrucomicrobiales bacterium]|jgi:glycerate kinase|nr:glycerate kinase [Verrucomicrobiales bacterium]|tara:strand:+ start:18842 stop:19963 length:1122 start_codon:yes stop_codon:yes gene_type:complete
MKILIACDKFKGSLTAPEACSAVAAGLVETLGDNANEIQLLPIADGGDGMARALTAAGNGKWVTCQVKNALGEKTEAGYGMIKASKVAVIEMAEASGLARMESRDLDPWVASTFGTGELILDAARRGVEEIVLGIGGSATNDGGSGMAEALGFRFLNSQGEPIDSLPADLEKAVRIVTPSSLNLPKITVACDVTNPLLGKSGCTTIYGQQKGIKPSDFARHEKRLLHLVRICGKRGSSSTDQPGAGAAGGLGFGSLVFLNAQLVAGFELVAEVLDLEKSVRWADLVITGEGKLDHQSLNGKAPHGIVQLARRNGISTTTFCGLLEDRALEKEFGPICEIRDPNLSIEVNMTIGAKRLREASSKFACSLLHASP